jgi:hypothetical protein
MSERGKLTLSKSISMNDSSYAAFEEAAEAILRAQSQMESSGSYSEASSQREARIMRMSMKMTETVNSNLRTPVQGRHEHSRMEDFILHNINLDHKKFKVYESDSEHSSEEERRVDLSAHEIEDIVDSVKVAPQNGKVTFVVKLVGADRADYNFETVHVRGVERDMPRVNKLSSCGDFELYEIETNSYIKRMEIHLKEGDRVLARTKPLAFSPRAVLIDLPLSYDFELHKSLTLNPLEGILAACVLEGEQLADEIIELNGKKAFRERIMAEKLGIGRETAELIENNQSVGPVLKLLRFFLDESITFGKGSSKLANPSHQALLRVFMTEMLKFKPQIGREDIGEASTAQSFGLITLFLHFLCLGEIHEVNLPFEPSSVMSKVR